MADEKRPGTLRMGPGTFEVSLKLHEENRKRLVESLRNNARMPQKSAVLLQGGDNIPLYSTDIDYVFRQDPYFTWTFGVVEPGWYGTIDVKTGKSILFMPHFPEEYTIWMGPIPSRNYFKVKYNVDEVHFVEDMVSVLKTENAEVLLVMKGVNSDSQLEIEPATFSGIEQFKLNNEVLYPIIADLRVFKTKWELDVIRYVTKISSDAHKQVMLSAKAGLTEYQCESIFLDYCYRIGGCRHVSYPCICGSGINSAVLHYGHAAAPNDRITRDGDMCLFDMGANYFGYVADITCSFPVNGKFTPDQKLIYEAVLQANIAVMKVAKPGVSWVDMHLLAGRTLLEGLKAGGLIKGSVSEMMEAGLNTIFQPHGLGHLFGLDVHDAGAYLPGQPERPTHFASSKLRTARILQPGMCVTVEPGCYFIKPLLEQARNNPELSRFLVDEVIQRFENFGGVRIEDDCIVTETGLENTTQVPRTVKEIEEWMATAK